MKDELFNELLESINQAAQHRRREIQLKTTTFEIKEVPEMPPERIRRIRAHLQMTQSIFGKFMGVSTRAVEDWEGGRSKPKGPARRMLSMLEDDELSSGMTEKFMVRDGAQVESSISVGHKAK